MSQAVTRLGDFCGGHSCFPPRPNIEASETVFANNIGVHRKTDAWAVHCCVSCHDGILAEGSDTVFVEGLKIGRIGDPVSCGSYVKEGSNNVFSGG